MLTFNSFLFIFQFFLNVVILSNPISTNLSGHNYIGSEHLLLGLLREGEGVAARVLENLGADTSNIRTQVRNAYLIVVESCDCLGKLKVN